MTLHETAQSLHKLAVGGYFNHEKFSLGRLESMLKSLFKAGALKLGNSVAIEIAMPDGWWLCKVIHYNNRPDGFDYYIPETREQEARIWSALTR